MPAVLLVACAPGAMGEGLGGMPRAQACNWGPSPLPQRRGLGLWSRPTCGTGANAPSGPDEEIGPQSPPHPGGAVVANGTGCELCLTAAGTVRKSTTVLQCIDGRRVREGEALVGGLHNGGCAHSVGTAHGAPPPPLTETWRRQRHAAVSNTTKASSAGPQAPFGL